MKTCFRLLLCLLLTNLTAFAQNSSQALDSIFGKLFAQNAPGASVMIAREGRPIYHKAFGMANLELGVPMSTSNVFRIGSITKQFTAIAILQLTEAGKLSITDKFDKYFPGFPSGNKITIEALLTHTSGVKNYTSLPAFNEKLKRMDLTPLEIIALFEKQPLDFQPGDNQLYSNSGYILLGYIIEKVSGMSYANYMKEKIFIPLEMDQTSYEQAETLTTGKTSGYRPRNGSYVPAPYLSMTLPYAAGALVSTTSDLLKWYSGLLSGKIITKNSLEKAFTSYLLANGKNTGYGYGWEIGNIQGNRSVKHNGVVNGFFGQVVYLPKQNILGMILCNNEYMADIENSLSKAMAIVLGQPYQFAKKKLTRPELENYQGKYLNPYDGERHVAYQEDQLVYFHRGGSKSKLVPYLKDRFQLENSLNTLNFQRDAKGKLNGYQWVGTGVSTLWTKSSEPITKRRRIELPAKILSSYTGKYEFGKNMIFEIVMENGLLFARMGRDKKEIVPFEKNKFYAKEIDAVLIFNFVDGKIQSVTKIQNSEMIGHKIE